MPIEKVNLTPWQRYVVITMMDLTKRLRYRKIQMSARNLNGVLILSFENTDEGFKNYFSGLRYMVMGCECYSMFYNSSSRVTTVRMNPNLWARDSFSIPRLDTIF